MIASACAGMHLRFADDFVGDWCCSCAAFIGALAYLGPKAGRDVFGISGETADLVFGGVTVLTGVFGTLAGGLALDALGASMANGLALCAGGMLTGWVAGALHPHVPQVLTLNKCHSGRVTAAPCMSKMNSQHTGSLLG